jgi:OH-DDVA meta-cleavage compound hydrolase
MRKLYYDTVLYTPEAIELLIKVVGTDQCLFGAECFGVGSSINPDTGRHMDDVAHHIEAMENLSDAEKDDILVGNAKRMFTLDIRPIGA